MIPLVLNLDKALLLCAAVTAGPATALWWQLKHNRPPGVELQLLTAFCAAVTASILLVRLVQASGIVEWLTTP